MIKELWLIGIGTGSMAHITQEGLTALRQASVLLIPRKGEGKDDLADIRLRLVRDSGATAKLVHFDYPRRDPSLPYQSRVSAWHDEIARRWEASLEGVSITGPVGLLVWGDPSLYDSTMRIAARLEPAPELRIVPGITAIQALTAAHAIPLNSVNGPIGITTGRRLRDHGWPDGAQTLVVMLDGEAEFQSLDKERFDIWWGAFLGMPEQVIDSGSLRDVSDRIIRTRSEARARHGWIMDTYLLRLRD